MVEAQMRCAVMYDTGDGVLQNRIKALHWYEEAAALENVDAQYRCGRLYADGDGVPQDEQMGLYWPSSPN